MSEQDVIRILIEAPIAGLAIFAIARLGSIAIASIQALRDVTMEVLKARQQ